MELRKHGLKPGAKGLVFLELAKQAFHTQKHIILYGLKASIMVRFWVLIVIWFWSHHSGTTAMLLSMLQTYIRVSNAAGITEA